MGFEVIGREGGSATATSASTSSTAPSRPAAARRSPTTTTPGTAGNCIVSGNLVKGAGVGSHVSGRQGLRDQRHPQHDRDRQHASTPDATASSTSRCATRRPAAGSSRQPHRRHAHRGGSDVTGVVHAVDAQNVTAATSPVTPSSTSTPGTSPTSRLPQHGLAHLQLAGARQRATPDRQLGEHVLRRPEGYEIQSRAHRAAPDSRSIQAPSARRVKLLGHRRRHRDGRLHGGLHRACRLLVVLSSSPT